MGGRISTLVSNICCEWPSDNNNNGNSKNNKIIDKESIEFYSIKSIKKENMLNIKNFKFVKLIGKGGYGKVFLAKNLINNQHYAIKSISITNKKNFNKIITEKKILSKASHPFIMNLEGYFYSNKNLCLVMEYQEFGDLYLLFIKNKIFNLEIIKFVTIEIIIGLNYLHNNLKVIYRDLKLQNILINNKGHIKICDFGLSKLDSNQANTFCGTMSFIAPEVFTNNYDYKVDYWTLGCLLYYMYTGKPPFESKNPQRLIELIKFGKFNLELIHDENFKNLISNLIEIDPNKRFNLEQIRNHVFFKDSTFDIFNILKEKSPILNYLENEYNSDLNNSNSEEIYFESIMVSEKSNDIFNN